MQTSYNTHDLGDLVQVYTDPEFTNSITEAALDPDTVSVSVRNPSGDVTTYVYGTDPEVVKDGVGEYHINIDANEAGRWHVRFFSTGNGQAAEERMFVVRAALAVEEET